MLMVDRKEDVSIFLKLLNITERNSSTFSIETIKTQIPSLNWN